MKPVAAKISAIVMPTPSIAVIKRHPGGPQRTESDQQHDQRDDEPEALDDAEAGRLLLYASPPIDVVDPGSPAAALRSRLHGAYVASVISTLSGARAGPS